MDSFQQTRSFIPQQLHPLWLHFRDSQLEKQFHIQTQRDLLDWRGIYDIVLLTLILTFAVETKPGVGAMVLSFILIYIYRVCLNEFPSWRLFLSVGWFVACIFFVLLLTIRSERLLAGIVLFHHLRIIGGVSIFRRWLSFFCFSLLCEICFFLALFAFNCHLQYVEEPAFLAAFVYGCLVAYLVQLHQRHHFLLANMMLDHQRHWKQLTDSSPDGVVVYSVQSKSTLYSNGAAEPFLISDIDLEVDGLGFSMKDLFPASHLFEHVAAVCQHDQSIEFACRTQIRGEGGIRHYSIVASSFQWLNVHSIVFLLRDTTSRFQVQALRRASVARNLLWASLSHNLRTPLNGILAAIEPLQQQVQSDDGLQMFKLLKSSADLLNTFISGILDYISMESNQLQLNITAFDVVELVRECTETAKHARATQNVAIRLQFLSPIERRFHGDANRIKQILVTMLWNAVKHTREGFIEVRAHMSEHDTLRIEVHDTGVGIPEEQQDIIFSWLKLAINSGYTTSLDSKLCGFGLPLSKALCEVMNGDIGVRSQVGHGSLFWFSVPELDIVVPYIENTGTDMSAIRSILIVDDNPFNRAVLVTMLKGIGCVIHEAADGMDALKMYRLHPYDVVLMDLLMPVMDGQQATDEIRHFEKSNHIPPCIVIAVTAFAGQEHKAKCLTRGMDGFVVKPVDRKDLLNALSSCVRMDRSKHSHVSLPKHRLGFQFL